MLCSKTARAPKIGLAGQLSLNPSLSASPLCLPHAITKNVPKVAGRCHIYMYAGELMGCPRFGLQRVNGLAALKVNGLSAFLGGHFRAIKIGFLRIFGFIFGPK